MGDILKTFIAMLSLGCHRLGVTDSQYGSISKLTTSAAQRCQDDEEYSDAFHVSAGEQMDDRPITSELL